MGVEALKQFIERRVKMDRWKRLVSERGLRLPGFAYGNACDDPNQDRKDRKVKNLIRATIKRITDRIYEYYREKYGEDPSDRESGEGTKMA